MKNKLKFIILTSTLFFGGQSSAALISTFDSDAEGWGGANAGVTLQWLGTGGNPDGYLHGYDHADGRVWYYRSPDAWSGDWGLYDSISFDLKIVNTGGGVIRDRARVKIVGNNGDVLDWAGDSGSLGTSWSPQQLSLSAGTFGVTDAYFTSVIGDVTALWISGDHTSGVDQTGLDNVIISSIPIPGTLLLFSSSLLCLPILGRKRKYSRVKAN